MKGKKNPNRRTAREREFSPTTYAPRLNSKAAVEHALKFFPKIESRYTLASRKAAWGRIVAAAKRFGVKVTGTMKGKAGLLNKAVADFVINAATTQATENAKRDLAWEIKDFARQQFIGKTPPEHVEEKERKNWARRMKQRTERRLREIAWKASEVLGFKLSPEVILAAIAKTKGAPEVILKLNAVVGDKDFVSLDVLKKDPYEKNSAQPF